MGSQGRRATASAIICTLGRPAMLQECLQSLTRALAQGDELIVVVAGTADLDDVVKTADSGPSRGQVLASPPGKSHQLNAGIREANGELLVFTDDDVRVPEDWVDRIASEFEDPNVGAAFGHVLGLTTPPGFEEPMQLPPGEAPLETWEFAHGAAMAIRAVALRQIGGFDERLGPGAAAHGEEHDVVLRLRSRGWRVVVSSAPAVHHLDWRSEVENRDNALLYERGGGAFIGAAIRRSPTDGMRLLRRRVGYQRMLIRAERRFGYRALPAFARGLLFGLTLKEQNWLETDNTPSASRAGEVPPC